jgi:integrase/recombinase XerD
MEYKEKRKMILEMREAKEELHMQAAIDMFIKSRKLKNLTSNTAAFYSQTLTKFTAFLEENDVIKPTEVILEDVQEFIQIRMDKGNSIPTINKYIRSLRAFFNFLCSAGYMLENPMESVDKLVEDKRIIRTLSRDQAQRLLDIPNRSTPAGYRNYVFMLLLLDTGMRLEEALSFGVEDIYWQERVIQVFGKNRHERVIPFSEVLSVHLLEYLELRGDSDSETFFTNVDGKPLRRRTIQEEISDYGKIAGIKGVRISCHSLRYTFARNYLLNGGNIMTLKVILGHKTLAMTELYCEMFQPDISRQHAKFSPVSSIFN